MKPGNRLNFIKHGAKSCSMKLIDKRTLDRLTSSYGRGFLFFYHR